VPQTDNTGTTMLPLGNSFYKKSLDTGDMPGMVPGTESMMSKYSVFSLARVNAAASGDNKYNTDLHYDVKSIQQPSKKLKPLKLSDNTFDADTIKKKASHKPTISEIINNSKYSVDSLTQHMPYSIQDFYYCTHYGKVPNNMMVTLRRYPVPVYDSARSHDGDNLVPVAQAVTYFGEKTGNKVTDLMKFSYGLVWEEIEAEVQSVDGNEQGLGTGIETLLGKKNVSRGGTAMTIIGANPMSRWDGSAKVEQEWLKEAWGDKGSYWNQVYGPVNVVHKTYMRKRGMKFDQTLKIRFSYSLRSWNGINPKVAMLDIISNFLLLTYNNAKFFGGATRYFPNMQDQVKFLGSQKALYEGQWGNYFSSVKDDFKTMGKDIFSSLGKLLGGDFGELKKLAGSGIDTGMGKLAGQSRPKMLSIRSMLSGAPMGEWHVTIGNPLDPMMVMGNMIVDGVEFSVSDTLGADDFPTEIYFDVTLKHGKPRDLGDIESMFNMGMGKMSYTPLMKLPSEQNTNGDASNKQRGKDYEKRNDFARDTKTYSVDQLMQKYLTTTESKNAYDRAKGRISEEWGNKFGNSKHLVYLMSKTGCKF